ncbi:MAG: hypothetical protein D6798_08155 [Deltaproteobacteria bacterium]|nr:MAG: hypothetical protein D6798_08155 [Deltaproteobacteria bacterium]
MSVVARLVLLPTSPADVGGAVRAALARAGVELLPDADCGPDGLEHQLLAARGLRGLTVLLGGPEIPDPAVMARIRDALDGRLPGFDHGLRQVQFGHLGARAVLADGVAGRCGDGVVVALPGSEEVAAEALTTLVLPILDRLLPAPADDAPRPGSHVDLVQAPAGPAAPRPDADEPTAGRSGWQAGLAAIGGQLDRDRWPPLPAVFSRVAPARNVLETAGERATCVLPDGRRLPIFGWPDLRRSHSKVLLVAEGEPLAEVVALHRHPRQVGVVSEGGAGLLPGADSDLDSIARERTGSPPPDFGTLFALEGGTVYYRRNGRIWSWDGSRERDEGSPTQAFASLLLRWSQR